MAEFKEVFNNYKRMCEKSKCEECAINWHNNEYEMGCGEFVLKHADKAEKIIMDWAKEHPKKTNLDKFREVFGNYEINKGACMFDECPEDKPCRECNMTDFWEQEYQEPKKKV